MTRWGRAAGIALVAASGLAMSCRGGAKPKAAAADCGPDAGDWTQWSREGAHGGFTCAHGQLPEAILASAVVDEHAEAEKAEAQGDLLAHYQTPLIAGSAVLVEHKGGRYTPCAPPGTPGPGCGAQAWEQQRWSEVKYRWSSGALVRDWSYDSTWWPPPVGGGLDWEPVFHAAVAGKARDLVAIPAAGGAIDLVALDTGKLVRSANPFAASGWQGGDIFVTSPLVTDNDGDVVYTAIRLDGTGPWDPGHDATGYLVRASVDGSARAVPFAALVPSAPAASDACQLQHLTRDLPTLAPAPSTACGSQRPPVNAAPAVDTDGTLYVVSRAHHAAGTAFLVAVNPDLTPRWAASLRGRLSDGCGALVPSAAQNPDSPCHPQAADGVDPWTNAPPAGYAHDDSTSSPVVLPDHAVLYGAWSGYNASRGHLFKFSAAGEFLGTFDFGWDNTPAVFPHDGTYSIIVKDNHYPARWKGEGPYLITQLDASLRREWSVGSGADAEHPGGYEWCVNAVAVDAAGNVYANSEDGHVYAIAPGGEVLGSTFLGAALGAAYTPISLDAQGRIYAQNNGALYVVGSKP